MAIDPDVAAQVAHLFDATLAQVLTGEVEGPPAATALHRDDVTTTDATVAGSGGPVGVRLYRSAALAPTAPAPTLVWAHGGGWGHGSLDMPEADSVAQVVAATLPGVVVSVEYRLAPRHRFPAPMDDVVAVQHWAVTRGESHGIDPGRVVLGGASAGAHLALLAAVALTEAGTPPAALFLAYPVVDPVDGPYPPERHPDCPPVLWLDGEAMTAMFEQLVGEADQRRPEAVPMHADLSGLPPTLVTTAECDALAPQAHRFAELTRRAGVRTAVHDVGGVLHGYLNSVGDSPLADAALARHVAWFRSTGIDPGNY